MTQEDRLEAIKMGFDAIEAPHRTEPLPAAEEVKSLTTEVQSAGGDSIAVWIAAIARMRDLEAENAQLRNDLDEAKAVIVGLSAQLAEKAPTVEFGQEFKPGETL